MLNMIDPHPRTAAADTIDTQVELSTFLSQTAIKLDPPAASKGGLDLEMALPSPVTKMQMTPESETTLFLTTTPEERRIRPRRVSHAGSISPCPTISSKEEPVEEEKSLGLSRTAVVEASTEHLMTQVPVDNTIIRRPSLPLISGPPAPVSVGRRGFSEDTPRTPGRMGMSLSEDDYDALDRALEEEYDENGKRRPPKRTHHRRWKSDEMTIANAPEPSSPTVALPTRPAEVYQPGQLSPTWQSSNAIASSSSLPIPRTENIHPSVRSRLSILLHRHKAEESTTPTVPEEGGSRRSSPVPPPVSSTSRISNNRRISSKSNAARIRRLLAANGPPSPGSMRTGRARGESDAATICSASTGWAFDNTNTHDAPDFCN